MKSLRLLRFLLVASIITFFFIGTALAQTWEKIFGGANNDFANSVQQTTDGGYIVVGSTARSSDKYSDDVWLIKTDDEGSEIWNKTFGGNYSDVGYSVQQTTDGGYIIVGATGFTDEYEGDLWLIKTDDEGSEIWNKTFGGNYSDVGYSVQQTTDGGYIIVGETDSFGAGGMDVFLIKTDANGNQVWSKTFGGSGYDSGHSVQQTTDGGYIIVGETDSFGAGEEDVWLIRTNVDGNQLWSKTFGGASYDHGHYVRQTTDSGYIIVGDTWVSGEDRYDLWLIKTDDEGSENWKKTFGGSNIDIGYCLQQTSDGGYIIAGLTSSFGAGYGDVWLIRTNVNGNQLWSKTFGGASNDHGRYVRQTTDGGYIIVGDTRSFGAGGSDVYMIYYKPENRAMPGIPLLLLDD